MPSNSETLKLTAQVVDKYSKEIRDFQRSLRTLGEHGKAVNVEGARYAKVHKDSFEALRKTARETSDHFKNVFNPAMVLGFPRLPLAGRTKSIKDVSDFSKAMSFASKETGLSINKLNAFMEAGSRVNIPTEAMVQGLTQVNEKLSQFEKYRDSALQTFFAVNAGNPFLAKLAVGLRALKGDRDKQDRLIQETYANVKEADQHLLEEQFGEQNFRRFNMADVDEAAKKLHQWMEKEIADGKALAESFDDSKAAFKKFKDELSISLNPAMKELNTEFRAAITGDWDTLKQHFEADLKSLATELGDFFEKYTKPVKSTTAPNDAKPKYYPHGPSRHQLEGLPGPGQMGPMVRQAKLASSSR